MRNFILNLPFTDFHGVIVFYKEHDFCLYEKIFVSISEKYPHAIFYPVTTGPDVLNFLSEIKSSFGVPLEGGSGETRALFEIHERYRLIIYK